MLVQVNNNTLATENPRTVPRYTVPAVIYKNIEHASMNLPVLSAVCGVFLLYVLGLLWIKRIRSKEQVHIGATIIPHRSFYRHPHHYFLLFYTGSGRHAGTTANVYCVIHGKKKKTKPIVLRDPERLLFQSGTTTSFLLTLNKSLDQITKLHLWHDISGPKPSWFLERVVVCHLNTGLLWHFEAHRWLDVSENDGSVECVLHAIPRSQFLRRKTLFDQMFSKSFANHHIWFSPFLLKCRTTFSRVERFTSCLAVTMVTVLVVTVAVESKKDSDVFPNMKIRLGPLAFELSDIIWGVVCGVIPFLLRLLLELLFTYSESKAKQLPPDERDVKTHMEWCLTKANEITFLDGQSNTFDDEKGNTDELEDGEEEKEMEIEEDGRDSELEYMDESWSEVSLRSIGLDLTQTQDSLVKSQNESEKVDFEPCADAKSNSSTDDNFKNAFSDRPTSANEGVVPQNQDENDTGSPTSDENCSSNGGQTEPELSSTPPYKEQENRDDIQLITEPSDLPNGISTNKPCKLTNHPNVQSSVDLLPKSNKGSLSNGACVKEAVEDTESLFESGRTSTSTEKMEPEKEENPTKTEQTNFAYTNSLTNTDRIPKLWKMIPLPGFLIDPNCVRIRDEKNTLRLSVRFFYLAAFVCLLMALVSPVVTIRYGFAWSTQITTSWLMTIVFALLFQILIAESFYMFIRAIYFGAYLQRPVEENDIINEQKNKVWAKEEDDVRYYVDDLDDVSSSVPRPPSAKEVEKAREKAGQDRQLEEVLMMVAFDVLFLLQLVIISFGNRDAWSFPMRTVVESNYDIANFSTIQNTTMFWSWTKTHLVTGLYYEGKFKQANSRQTRDGYGTLLGVPTLRQQRIIPNGTCELNNHAMPFFAQCNVPIPSSGQYDERDYNPGWKYKSASDVITQSPWIHKTGIQSNTDYTMFARIASYKSGGYIAPLGYNKSSALKILEELENMKWIDRFTRVVFVEYASYNGNINILSDIAIAVEFTAFGGAFPRFDHFSFRLYRYFTPLQLIYLVCEVIFVVFIVQLLYKVICQIHEQRLAYFHSFWNWTDVVLVIASLVTIGLYAARAILLQNGIKAIQQNPFLFYGFYSIALYDNLVAFMSCIVVIIPVLQFLKFLKFNKSFMIFDMTLKLLMPDLKGFAMIFLVSLFTFAFWAYHMLSTALESYSTFIGAFNSILSMLLGKFSFRVFSPGESLELGPYFTYVFTVVNVFYIMTIILCIITLAFKQARQDESLQQSKYEIVKFIIHRLKDALGLNPPYIPPKPVIKSIPVDYNQLQLELNTQYVLRSQLTRISRFANTVYSEETIDDVEIFERLLGLDNGAEYLKTIIRKRQEERQALRDRQNTTVVENENQEHENLNVGKTSEEIANSYDQGRRLSTLSIENECSGDFIA